MAKPSLVGRSSRTPFKHWVLDTHLGKIAGVLSTRNRDVPAIPNPFLCVDLCAGDGSQSDVHRCSPAIITKHCEWLHSRGIHCETVLIEQDQNTFDALQNNVIASEYRHRVTMICGDSKEYRVRPTCRNQAVFVNCDPNAISDMPLAGDLADSLTPTTTITMTLGCNVGGVKRLSRDKREEWFCYADRVVARMPSWHDAIVIRLVRDSDQWAYITRLPRKWSRKQAEDIKRKGEQLWPNGVEVAVLSDSVATFTDMLTRLFLTEAEYNAR